MAGEDILAALQSPLYSGADTYSGIAAGGVANALPALVDPYGSTGSNALNVFGGTILAALLGNMAKEDAAEQNASIATKQSQFMNASPQERLALTQQDPRTFAKLQAALNTNDLLQQAQDKATQRQLEIQDPFKVAAEKRAIQGQIDLATNPTLREAQLADTINKKRGEKLADAQANNIIFGNDPLKNPDSPEFKINQLVVKEEDAARSEIAKIPSVSQFAAMQKSLPLVKAFKDPDTKSSDVGFVYNYIKALDEGAVRGEEINMANASNPLVLKFRTQLQGAIDGSSELTPTLKNQMYQELQAAQGGVYSQALLDAQRRFEIAKSRGVQDFSRVLPFDPGLKFGEVEQAQTLPPIGDPLALAELKSRGVIP